MIDKDKTREQLIRELQEARAGHRRTEEHLFALRRAVEQMQLGVTITDAGGKIVYTNPAEARMHGYPIEELIGKDARILAPASLWRDMSKEEMKKFKSWSRESLSRRKDGTSFPVWLISDAITNDEGEPVGIVTISEDITESKRMDTEFERFATKFTMHDKFIRGVLDSISSRIAIMDQEGYIIEVNEAWKRFSLENDAVGINKIGIGANYIKVCQNAKGDLAESAQGAAEGLRNVLSGAASAFLLEYSFTSETEVEWFLMHVTPLEGKDGGAVVTHTNITALKKMEEELHTLSIMDSLTGLYNRRGFFIMADKQIKMARRINSALLLFSIDLDDLKKINDIFGHQEGDLALVATANILKATCLESDVIARIGGDEFVVIHIGAAQKNIEVITARLQENVEHHNAIGNRDYRLSISFGMSWYYPESPRSIDELLANADKMMYEQKRLKTKS